MSAPSRHYCCPWILAFLVCAGGLSAWSQVVKIPVGPGWADPVTPGAAGVNPGSAATATPLNGPVVGYWKFRQNEAAIRQFEIVLLNRDGEGSGYLIRPATVEIYGLTIQSLTPSALKCVWVDQTGVPLAALGKVQADGSMQFTVELPDGTLDTSKTKALTWLPDQLPTTLASAAGSSDSNMQRWRDDQKRYSDERDDKRRDDDRRESDRRDQERLDAQREQRRVDAERDRQADQRRRDEERRR